MVFVLIAFCTLFSVAQYVAVLTVHPCSRKNTRNATDESQNDDGQLSARRSCHFIPLSSWMSQSNSIPRMISSRWERNDGSISSPVTTRRRELFCIILQEPWGMSFNRSKVCSENSCCIQIRKD